MRTNSPVSDAEMERRRTLTRRVMADLGLDALIAHAREDWMGGYVRWLTDVPANNGYPRTVIVFPDRPMTVVEMGAFGTDWAADPADPATRGVGRVLGTPSFHSVHYTVDYDTELVVRALDEVAARRVGLLCPLALPYGLARALVDRFETVDASDALDRVKAVKSEEEIGLIRRTAELQDRVFEEVCDFLRPGITDRDVAAHAEAVGRRLGSDQGIHLGVSAPLGRPSRFLNRPFQVRELRPGDHLSLLIEVNGPGGIYLEIARTMVLGPADDHLLEAFENVKAAQAHTLSLIRPGADPVAIARAHDEWMQARGLPPERRLYAHGQGCEMVERPLIRDDETMPLAAGMLLAVHPGYEDGRVFAVICDNYLVTETGVSECLHRTEKKVFELRGDWS
jgi:Xaa-Pro aminopeptidase